MTKNESNDSKQQKQLKELAYQVQRFVNLKLGPAEQEEEGYRPPLPPQKKSEEEGHRDALSGLTLLTPEQISSMDFDVPTKNTPTVQPSKLKIHPSTKTRTPSCS